MLKKIYSSLIAVSALFFMAIPLAAPAPVSADDANITGSLCQGASLSVDSGAGCSTTSVGTEKINALLHSVVNIFSLIVGIAAVFMIIIGGFRYITSGGASDNVSGAKNTIIYAIIGLVIVALAQFIVQFVLNKVTTTGN